MKSTLSSIFLVIWIMLGGHVFAQSLHIQARVPQQFLWNDAGVDKIISGAHFYVELIWDYDNPGGQNILGGCFAVHIQGNNLYEVIPTPTANQTRLPSPYDHVILKNGFNFPSIYWNTFGGSSVDWPWPFCQRMDGNMPDTFAHAFAGTTGLPPNLGPTAFYELHYVGVNGYIRIDSIRPMEHSYDWALDYPASFSGLNLEIITCCLPPAFTNCPGQINIQPNVPVSYDFDAVDYTLVPITYQLTSGPGTIDSITGEWSWDADCAFIPELANLVVCARTRFMGCLMLMPNECVVELAMENRPPVLHGNCDSFVVYEDYNLQFTSSDSDITDSNIWSVSAGVMPEGTLNISEDGLFHYRAVQADFGKVFNFNIRVSDCAGAYDECIVGLNVIGYICGDASGNRVVNMLDVTYLMAYLYKDGPNPHLGGDANGNGVVNILDATYLLSSLYKGGPAPICP